MIPYQIQRSVNVCLQLKEFRGLVHLNQSVVTRETYTPLLKDMQGCMIVSVSLGVWPSEWVYKVLGNGNTGKESVKR